jgi:glycosyltransferase involved in cell wall biosynthesis
MIPAYNAADYLAKTIRSVLVQDPGPEAMQIEVVDDHSLKEDLRAVVEEVGRGRVGYYRQPRNVGVVENFNTCIQRARGQWVHILHGDDTVLPGYYERLGAATGQRGVGAAFCRYLFMNEEGHWMWISELEASSAGAMQAWIGKIAVRNRVMAPAIIVARWVYEELGGYDPRLFHCADWDMWKRIGAGYPVWYEPTVLACYRTHSKSDTSRLMRTGKNVEDIRRSIALAKAYLPEAAANDLTRRAYDTCALGALDAASGMLRRRDFGAAVAQTREALKASCSVSVLVRSARTMGRGVAALLWGSLRRSHGKGVRAVRAAEGVTQS